MKNFILFVSLSAIMASCSSNNVDLAIDNPTENAVIVKVDTLTVEVPAKEVVWVEMGKGEHSITTEDEKVTKFNFQESVYMVNPTLSQYLKVEEFYGDPIARASFTPSIPSGIVTYYGLKLEGNYDVVNGLITPVTWDYGPREELPQSVEIDEDDKFASLVKLMDPSEFMGAMSKALEQNSEENKASEEKSEEKNK